MNMHIYLFHISQSKGRLWVTNQEFEGKRDETKGRIRIKMVFKIYREKKNHQFDKVDRNNFIICKIVD